MNQTQKLFFLSCFSLPFYSAFSIENYSEKIFPQDFKCAINTETPPESFKTKILDGLEEITPDEKSKLESRIQEQKKINKIPGFFSWYKPNYMLPLYYTSSPYNEAYNNDAQDVHTPNNQKVISLESKGQVSVTVPVYKSLFGNEDMSLDVAFTEMVYWQTLVESQYFRETDAEATMFFKYHFYRNWLWELAVDHQSNGKGEPLERSWNRVISTVQFSSEHFFVQGDFWFLIFKAESANLHNPDITDYLGHENIVVAYKMKDLTLSVSLQNIESGLQKGNFGFTATYPMNEQVNLYAQYINGYGQSLVEYNHRTQGMGIGVSFSNYL